MSPLLGDFLPGFDEGEPTHGYIRSVLKMAARGGIAKNEISFLMIGFGACTAGLVATVGPRARGATAGVQVGASPPRAASPRAASPLPLSALLTRSPLPASRCDLED